MDCAFYIPGGRSHNCTGGRKAHENTVGGLNEACRFFKDKNQPQEERIPRKRKKQI